MTVTGAAFGAVGTAVNAANTTVTDPSLNASTYDKAKDATASSHGQLKIGNPLDQPHAGPLIDTDAVKMYGRGHWCGKSSKAVNSL